MTYGVVGVGAIASAIVTGLSDAVEDPPEILLSPRNANVSARLAARYPNVRIGTDNQAVVDGASTLVLSLRPQDAPAVLPRLHFSPEQSIVSVMAGVSIETLGRFVAPATAIARAIPLPVVAQRRCSTPILPPGGAARALFERLGGTIELEDARIFDAMSAATATVASHFACLETITRWLVRHGLSSAEATRYVAAMFEGLTPALQSGEGFDRLAQGHATRGGTNELFLAHLTGSAIFDSIDSGLDKVFQRLVG